MGVVSIWAEMLPGNSPDLQSSISSLIALVRVQPRGIMFTLHQWYNLNICHAYLPRFHKRAEVTFLHKNVYLWPLYHKTKFGAPTRHKDQVMGPQKAAKFLEMFTKQLITKLMAKPGSQNLVYRFPRLKRPKNNA